MIVKTASKGAPDAAECLSNREPARRDAFLQEMEAQDMEIFGGFRPLARRATAEIIEKAMHDAVDKHLDAIEQTCEAPDRRNGTHRRNLLTAIGDI